MEAKLKQKEGEYQSEQVHMHKRVNVWPFTIIHILDLWYTWSICPLEGTTVWKKKKKIEKKKSKREEAKIP